MIVIEESKRYFFYFKAKEKQCTHIIDLRIIKRFATHF